MKLSHSKLDMILKCPMTYYLTHIQGISPKTKSTALEIGSAVHWGIEHDTEDLSEYFKDNAFFKKVDNYTKDQLLPEAMVHGYLKNKDKLFEKILKDPITGEKLQLIEEYHELYITGQLKTTYLTDIDHHEFIGIIDLLLLTNKGFIIIDYKTSTYEPDWDTYLDQIYRYIMLIRSYFPNVPIVKTGIVNIRKTVIRQKKNENDIEFLNRMKQEYDLNDENYVNYHEYPMKDINESLVSNYINNLSKMCDMAYYIDKNALWYINFNNAVNQYGKSQFYDIFYHTPNNYLLYQISDHIWNEETKTFDSQRDCVALDMQVIDSNNILNKYETFKKEYQIYNEEMLKVSNGLYEFDLESFIENIIKPKYQTDESLLDRYCDTLLKEIM